MTEEQIISSGFFCKRPASIIHLENMLQHAEYDILIDGKKYVLKLSDYKHLWIIKRD